MLNDLGVSKIRLITNNPRKIAGLKGYGIEVVERLPLLIEATDYNTTYLSTKAEKLGHMLLQTYLATVAINWHENVRSITDRYEHLARVRALATEQSLLLQEEARPLGQALFGSPDLVVHLGFDQAGLAGPDWYRDTNHPYDRAIVKILDTLASWGDLQDLSFLISAGDDPMKGLQESLHREELAPSSKPSSLSGSWQLQTIYRYSANS